MVNLLRHCVFILLLICLSVAARATHLRTADISVEQLCDQGNLTFRITVTAYINTRSTTNFGAPPFGTADDGHINFGDGRILIIPEVQETPRFDLGPDIGIATFSVVHTYASPGEYQISYFERDRSSGVTNIQNAGDVPYVSFVIINARNPFGCNNHFPRLLVPPVDRACAGNNFTHTPGAVDDDGDSLSYELTIPTGWSMTAVQGYSSPIDRRFYIDPDRGNEDASGPATFSINPETGVLTWDAPGRVGEYNIAFKIAEWRKDPQTGLPVLLSTTVRDMQIVVQECVNQRPSFTNLPDDICVEAGEKVARLIRGEDPDDDNVKIEVISETLELPLSQSPASYAPVSPAFRSQPDTVKFEWNTTCAHVRQQPYQVIVKITDQPSAREVPLVTFHTMEIRVLSPKPIWKEHQLDVARRRALLKWQPYRCGNARTIQIWRKVGSAPYSPGVCETGLPLFAGFQLVGEVAGSDTSFIDNNRGGQLAVGARYYYRLLAITSTGVKSKVSDEVSIGPLLADAPVITHVSVEKTEEDNGSIRVSWRTPFGISKTQYPGPYRYRVYRGVGFDGSGTLTQAGTVQDTTFVDEGLNTRDTVFNYRVVLFSNTDMDPDYIAVDTSGFASSVRLGAISGVDSIKLVWRDSVPWSNVDAQRPWHVIYRGTEQNNMQKLDSVNVRVAGFTYVDRTVDANTYYYYKILTRGTYGNPAIASQENYSQWVSLYPANDLLPCPPRLIVEQTNCALFLSGDHCLQKDFSNVLHWEPPLGAGCRKDIQHYRIYAVSSSESEPVLIAAHVMDTIYQEIGLPSFARCYRVTAVDAQGRESEWSELICNDNCPRYELPNIFTPNNDGCNDVFGARNPADDKTVCGSGELLRCPMFTRNVKLRVYNRWGREVYTYHAGENGSLLINWDGKDNQGNLLQSSIYYYIADITFASSDPRKQHQQLKGWVHLIY